MENEHVTEGESLDQGGVTARFPGQAHWQSAADFQRERQIMARVNAEYIAFCQSVMARTKATRHTADEPAEDSFQETTSERMPEPCVAVQDSSQQAA